jgi:hypothetical protein
MEKPNGAANFKLFTEKQVQVASAIQPKRD